MTGDRSLSDLVLGSGPKLKNLGLGPGPRTKFCKRESRLYDFSVSCRGGIFYAQILFYFEEILYFCK